MLRLLYQLFFKKQIVNTMNLYKNFMTIVPLGLIAVACALPLSAHATNNERVAPLHIKIAPSKIISPKKSIAVNTQKSIPNTEEKNPAVINEPLQSSKTTRKKTAIHNTAKPKRVNIDDILDSVSCRKNAVAINKVKFTDKNLADSLKQYLTEKKQSSDIIDTLYRTSRNTGVDFKLLVVTAMIESDLGRMTISSSSSARGIYQFIEPTWLVLMKRYGERIGYKAYADMIEINKKTRQPQVTHGGIIMRQKILDLRYNKRIASLVKAYQIKDEERVLKSFKNGQNINITDHYIAHMLGLSLARTFYQLKQSESAVILSNLKNRKFHEAISLNRSFFYNANGSGLNASDAYGQFEKKIATKFKILDAVNKRYMQDTSPSACKKHTPDIRSVSADDILKHRITPLPKNTTTENMPELVSQVGAYAKTIKVKVDKQ